MVDAVRKFFIGAYERARLIHTPVVLVLIVVTLASFVIDIPWPFYAVMLLFFSVELIGNVLKQQEERPW